MRRFACVVVAGAVALVAGAGVVPTPAAAAVGPWLDTTDRAAVLAAFDAEMAAAQPAMGFTGSTSACRAGATSAAYRARQLRRVNFFRTMAGVAPVSEGTAATVAAAQRKATLVAANSRLEHDPPSTWRCYSQLADSSSGHRESLSIPAGVAGVDVLIDEAGDSNRFAGHRQLGLLDADIAALAFGSATDTGGTEVAAVHATDVTEEQATRSADRSVAWPPPGYVPSELLPHRWSLRVPVFGPVRLDGATVSVTVGGVAVEVLLDHETIDSVVFRPRIGVLPVGDTPIRVQVRRGATVLHTWTTTAVVRARADVLALYRATGLDARSAVDDMAESMGGAMATGERAQWATRLDRGTHDLTDLVLHLRTTPSAEVIDAITRLYGAYYLRPPDSTGLRYWWDQIRLPGWSRGRVSQAFASTPEFRTMYGSLTDRQFVDLVYRNVLGRPADADGLTYWSDQLRRGARTRGQVMLGFSDSTENRRRTAAATDVAVILGLLLRSPSKPEAARLADLRTTAGAGVLVDTLFSSVEYCRRLHGRCGPRINSGYWGRYAP